PPFDRSIARMSAYGFEWARICLEQTTGAAGLHARIGESSSGAPYASLTMSDDGGARSVTLQVADETMIATLEVATSYDEPTDYELSCLDDIAQRWPGGSLAWDRPTRTLLARAHLDAPEGRLPLASDLRATLNALLRAAPDLG